MPEYRDKRKLLRGDDPPESGAETYTKRRDRRNLPEAISIPFDTQ